MLITLEIDDDVVASARQIAQIERKTLGTVVSELARQSMGPVGIRFENGFPVFDVHQDAAPITDEDVARLL